MYRTRRGNARGLKPNFPALFDKIDTKRMHWLAVHQLPSGGLVQGAGGLVAFMRPELHFLVSPCLGKAHTGTQKPLSQPQTARLGHQKEQAQFCGLRVEFDAEDAPQSLALCLGDPALLTRWVMIGNKSIQNTRDQRGETVIKPLIAGIEGAVTLNQPRRILGLKGSDAHILHTVSERKGGLILNPVRASRNAQSPEARMGINTERDIQANLQIGPTDQGMVRLFIEADGVEIPMDFEPEEAEEIADEIRAAAQAARAVKD